MELHDISRLEEKSGLQGLQNNITWMTMYCRTPFTSGCRGSGTTFLRWEHMFLFTAGGRKTVTMIETALKINYTFSNVVVKS
jgi:ligand-binding SRPBCC domain-containing protein